MNWWYWMALGTITIVNLSLLGNYRRNGTSLEFRHVKVFSLLLSLATAGLALSHVG